MEMSFPGPRVRSGNSAVRRPRCGRRKPAASTNQFSGQQPELADRSPGSSLAAVGACLVAREPP